MLPVGELAGSMIWAFVLFIILTVIGYGIGFAAIKISPLTVFVIVGVVLSRLRLPRTHVLPTPWQIAVGL